MYVQQQHNGKYLASISCLKLLKTPDGNYTIKLNLIKIHIRHCYTQCTSLQACRPNRFNNLGDIIPTVSL
jgi:hypothetical protein